jgi:hypothetical protein
VLLWADESDGIDFMITLKRRRSRGRRKKNSH